MKILNFTLVVLICSSCFNNRDNIGSELNIQNDQNESENVIIKDSLVNNKEPDSELANNSANNNSLGFNRDSAYFEFINVHLPAYIENQKVYPSEAKKAGITGCVPVIYEINQKEGIIRFGGISPVVVKGHGKAYEIIGYGLEDEAKRVFESMSNWHEHELLLKSLHGMGGVINVCFP